MHNWFAMETEAEFRRQEWARAVSNDKRSTRLGARGEQSLLQRLSNWSLPKVQRREIEPVSSRGRRLAHQGAAS